MLLHMLTISSKFPACVRNASARLYTASADAGTFNPRRRKYLASLLTAQHHARPGIVNRMPHTQSP